MPTNNGIASIAPRALQLDAQALDDSLHSLLLQEYRNLLRHYPSSSLHRLIPEVTFLLRLLFHLNTSFIHRPTPGNALHTIVYSDTISSKNLRLPQRLGLLFFDAWLPYILSRARNFRAITESDAFTTVETLVKFLSFLNLFIFLRRSVYPSLPHRLLSIVSVHPRPTKPLRAAFEIVDSQLVWQGLAEFALFLAPVVRRLLKGGLLGIGGGSRRARVDGVCVSCSEGVVMAHRAVPCGCWYCYVCCREAEGGTCLGCGSGVAGAERVKTW